MGKEIITSGDSEFEKHIFHQHKSPIPIYDVKIDRIVVSNKVPFGKKVLNILLGKEMIMKIMMKKLCPCV